MKILKTHKTILAAVGLYLVSSVTSYAIFSNNNPIANNPGSVDSPVPDSGFASLLDIDPSEPKTEICPLNGQKYTKTEREAWEKRRPLIVMVENSPDARPHSGLIFTDVVYETVAEGGVTRFAAVYYCDAQAQEVEVAPVRSVRTYFIDWASEYGLTPLFAHVGGANCSAPKDAAGNQVGACLTDRRAQAIEQLISYGWRYGNGNDLDQFAIGAPTYVRNPSRLKDITGETVATEHSVVASTEGLWEIGEERGWTNLDPDGADWIEDFTPWTFVDAAEASDRGSVSSVSYDFWEGYKEFDVQWEYDSASNSYKRFNGGKPHTDLETGDQLETTNVVVLFTKDLGPVDDLKHRLYVTSGTGEALIFNNGEAIEARWSKSDREDRTIFTDKQGNEIDFVRGRIWISVLESTNEVAY